MVSESPLPRRMVYFGGLFEAGLGVFACLLGWLLGQPVWERLDWSLFDAGLGILACGPMLLVFAACLFWPIGPLACIKAFCDEVVRPLFAACSVFDLATLSLLAG